VGSGGNSNEASDFVKVREILASRPDITVSRRTLFHSVIRTLKTVAARFSETFICSQKSYTVQKPG
jgi:hypothetical protein